MTSVSSIIEYEENLSSRSQDSIQFKDEIAETAKLFENQNVEKD